jgi:hypothetical protein
LHAVLLKNSASRSTAASSHYLPFCVLAFASATSISALLFLAISILTESVHITALETILASFYSGTVAVRALLIDQLRLSGRSSSAPWFDNTLVISAAALGLYILPASVSIAFFLMLTSSGIVLIFGNRLTRNTDILSTKWLGPSDLFASAKQGFPFLISGLSSGYSRDILIWVAAIHGDADSVNTIAVIVRLFDLSNLPATAAFGYLNPAIASFAAVGKADRAQMDKRLTHFRVANFLVALLIGLGMLAFWIFNGYIFSSFFPVANAEAAAALTLMLLSVRLIVALVGNPYYYCMFWAPAAQVTRLAAVFFIGNFLTIVLAFHFGGWIAGTLVFAALYCLREGIEASLIKTAVGVSIRELSPVRAIPYLMQRVAEWKDF